ncbi:MAG: hypothetical protein NTX54_10345 [Chloroflexi bacterium]|nr:hypothetical protein [Chloroflexota bacterium]
MIDRTRAPNAHQRHPNAPISRTAYTSPMVSTAPSGASAFLEDAPGSQSAETVSWFLPGLLERPAVGTSCCATTAEALIASELSLVPGIVDLAIDTTTGWISVQIDPKATTPTDVAEALSEVGYGPDRSVLPGDVAASQ